MTIRGTVVVLVILAFVPTGATAQGRPLLVKVVDSTGMAISDAQVRLGTRNVAVRTDSAGRATFGDAPALRDRALSRCVDGAGGICHERPNAMRRRRHLDEALPGPENSIGHM